MPMLQKAIMSTFCNCSISLHNRYGKVDGAGLTDSNRMFACIIQDHALIGPSMDCVQASRYEGFNGIPINDEHIIMPKGLYCSLLVYSSEVVNLLFV